MPDRMPDGRNDGGRQPRLWVVTRDLGVNSQIWLLRQVLGFSDLRPLVVTWTDHRSPETRAEQDLSVHVLPFAPDLDAGWRRWPHRLARLPDGNFYAAGGAERRYLTRLAWQDRPDAILAHFGHAALRILPVATRMGVPVVVHFHGLDLSSSLRNRWYRTSLLRHLDRFDAAITVGTRQRDWVLQHHRRPESVHLIPCGAPLDEFSPARPSDATTQASPMLRWITELRSEQSPTCPHRMTGRGKPSRSGGAPTHGGRTKIELRLPSYH